MGFLNHEARRLLLRLEERLARARPDLLTKHVDAIVLRLNDSMVQAKKDVASAIADEKRLASEHRQETAAIGEWEARTQMARDAGHEALAQEALDRKNAHAESAASVHEAWSNQKEALDGLRRQLRTLNDQIEEAKRKRNAMLSRVRRDSAQRSIQRLSIALDEASAALAELDRLHRVA